eukprot:948565-Pyramimonas_sp.AAC.1
MRSRHSAGPTPGIDSFLVVAVPLLFPPPPSAGHTTPPAPPAPATPAAPPSSWSCSSSCSSSCSPASASSSSVQNLCFPILRHSMGLLQGSRPSETP